MKVRTPSPRAEKIDHHDVTGIRLRRLSHPPNDPELTLTVYGERINRKRSELVEAYDLAGRAAQKEMAADQRLRAAKGVSDQRLSHAWIAFLRYRRCSRLASAPHAFRRVRFAWLPERNNGPWPAHCPERVELCPNPDEGKWDLSGALLD
jgi:hypothetical protein